MSFREILNQTKVQPSSVAVFWIGQAGFLLKTAGGKLILIDPYLSDSVYEQTKKEDNYSFKRLTSALFTPDEIEFDLIFCSHEHGDHMDVGSMAALTNNRKTKVYSNPKGIESALKAGVPSGRITKIERGEQLDFGEFTLKTLTAQHGTLSPEAMGFLFDFRFVQIYYAGDTAYDLEALAPVIAAKPEIALLPINGAYGNLGSETAAKYAHDLQAKVCIPCHFWTFPIHLGDPQKFIEAMPKYAPDCKLCMLSPGEPYIYSAK